jgi:hypothetical protein
MNELEKFTTEAKEVDSIKPEPHKSPQTISTISKKLKTGEILEMVYQPNENVTKLVVWQNDSWVMVDSLPHKEHLYVPYSPHNTLIKHKILLLPSMPMVYGTVAELADEIRQFLHRYIDISHSFETIAVSYILLTWIYDVHNELPYLRFIGDPGSGKTRSLLTIGTLCYKPILASGASTISPIFRLLDSIRGTFVLDEGDFRFTDEKAEIIKILNNGNAKGFPVLRSELINKTEFNPKAFHVYGPKVIATRFNFTDHALETRCLTETMSHRKMRDDIPLNLPDSFTKEAEILRNKLLLYRFLTLSGIEKPQLPNFNNYKLEPRMKQLLAPLLSVTTSNEEKTTILSFAEQYQHDLFIERSQDVEAQVVEILVELIESNPHSISIKEVTTLFIRRFADDYERKITPKWIGSIIRRRLGLKTYKHQGIFYIMPKELGKIKDLGERFGVR